MLEIIHPDVPHGRVRHALFDFDGTFSLIRQGWQQTMIPMMVELLRAVPGHESDAEAESLVTENVTRLTGKQTIYQMIWLAEEIMRRGGTPLEPLAYKSMYLARLWERIKDRVAALKAGTAKPDDWMVPGARQMLEELHARGVRCYLTSGTDEPNVLEEAACLGVSHYFVSIHGAQDDYKRATKRQVIAQIVSENHLDGPELAAFGDGYVEIEEAKRVNGVAVGVATDEERREGLDAWKRTRLIGAGADIIVPDFRDHAALAAFLLDQDLGTADERR